MLYRYIQHHTYKCVKTRSYVHTAHRADSNPTKLCVFRFIQYTHTIYYRLQTTQQTQTSTNTFTHTRTNADTHAQTIYSLCFPCTAFSFYSHSFSKSCQCIGVTFMFAFFFSLLVSVCCVRHHEKTTNCARDEKKVIVCSGCGCVRLASQCVFVHTAHTHTRARERRRNLCLSISAQ